MKRELSAVGLAAAMTAFINGPPGVLRGVSQNDSTPPDYEPMGTTYHQARTAVRDAVEAYLEAMGGESADHGPPPRTPGVENVGMPPSGLPSRWEAFSDEELGELAGLVSAADESYDLSAVAERLGAEVKVESDNRRAWSQVQSRKRDKDEEKTLEHVLLRYFGYDHLPAKLQAVSQPFYELARELLAMDYLDGAEMDVALRKLLEAKDAAVRSML